MGSKEDDEFCDAVMRKSFASFAIGAFKVVEPAIEFENNWHIHCIAEHLEALDRGEIEPRLIINIPPRTLKSYMVAQTFPAWKLGHAPQTKFISTSYGLEVAEANARRCKQIMTSDWYNRLFPLTKISPMLDRIMHYETTMSGQYYAASALSPITGLGADWVIVDDPLKPMEAYSDAIRNSTNQNIRTTLLNRFNDKRTGKFVMIMQRLHDDDPTANLARDGGYHILKLPAETKTQISVVLPHQAWTMRPNSLLFKARLSRETLNRLRIDMSEANYAGQFLQEPVAIGGGEFKDGWVQHYAQGSVKPKEMNVYILVDQAGGEELNRKKRKLSDWTALLVIGLAPDNNYYLLDAVRDRLNPTERIETIFQLHKKWNALTGKPPKVGCEQIGLMTDTHYLKEKQKQEAYHFPIVPLGSGQRISKEERIRKMIPDMQNGRWWTPDSLTYVDIEGRRWDLVRELVDVEMATFPRSRYDDMIDCLSRIYDVELNAIFPKPKVGTVAKARMAAAESVDNWESW